MKIVCNRDKLNEAIQIVSRAVATKSNLASIEGILLIAENDTLTLTGYDFEMGIKTTFECEVEREGDVVLNAQLLGNIVRKVNNDYISIECDEKMNCVIKSGITKYNIKGFDSTEEIANTLLAFVFDGAEIFSYADILQNMDFDYVNALFEEFFDPSHMTISIITPENQKGD
jgi:hypothetical protein